MDAYVKFFEASGARVVPLVMGEPQTTTDDKIAGLNGVVFPGGAGNYRDYGEYIINELKLYNDQGLGVYPAYGICLGFENMIRWASDAGFGILGSYSAHESLKLDFIIDDLSSSTMW